MGTAREPGAGPFEMTVTDVFTITGRGVAVTGAIAGPLPHAGDRLKLTDDGELIENVTCLGVVDGHTTTGDAFYGVLVGEIDRDTVRAGQLLTVAT